MLSRKSIWGDQVFGATVNKLDNLIKKGCNQNANMNKNPEMLHKYTADESTTKYALSRLLTGEEADAHVNADLHIHDLEFMAFRPMNCLQHDLRFFFENGLKVDGTGYHTSQANAPNNMFTAVNHIGQILGAGQVNMSGGQSIPFINTFLAPYSYGISDKELKQAMQMLIFNINMSYVSRGGQSVFSSFNIDLEMPEFLKDECVVSHGRVEDELDGLYGDYQAEAKRIAHTIIEVMLEGDGSGKPHLFPNIIFQLNDNVCFDEWNDLFQLSAKFGLPYFNKPINDKYSLVMGCRTRLTVNWTGNWERDLVRTGNLAYVSLNLPKYALMSTGRGNVEFYETLLDNLVTASNILQTRRKHSEDCLNKYELMNFLNQKGNDGEPYYRIEDSTLSFGIVGLYETVKILGGNQATAINILNFINDYSTQLTKDTGIRWTVIGSPAESTAGRFAIANKREFGNRAMVNGTTNGYYYTNSTHVPVDDNMLLPEKIKLESMYHKYTQGGHILNLFMGEGFSVAESMQSLTEKIYNNSDAGFWTYSSIYCICKDCNTQFAGVQPKCSICGSSDIEVYDRITGYMQRVSGWNPSKTAEYIDRRRYNP